MHFAIRLALILSALIITPRGFAAETCSKIGASEGWPVPLPSPSGKSESVGKYNNGCMFAAKCFQTSQAIALANPKRNHQCAHEQTIAMVNKIGEQNFKRTGKRLLVGDSSAPHGGLMDEGHNSHQSGLDVDIFYRLIGQEDQWEKQADAWSASEQKKYEIAEYTPAEVGKPGSAKMIKTEVDDYMAVLRHFAEEPDVQRIFVSPAIKKHLCEKFPGRAWLKKIRPMGGHKSHFHVRLRCPKDSPHCVGQDDQGYPPDDPYGCDQQIADMLKAKDKSKQDKPTTPPAQNEPKPPTECKTPENYMVVQNGCVRCLLNHKNSPPEIIGCRNYTTSRVYYPRTTCSLAKLKGNFKACVVEGDSTSPPAQKTAN